MRRLHFAAATLLLAAGGLRAQQPAGPAMPPWPSGPAASVRPLTPAERATLPAAPAPGFFAGVRSFVGGAPGTTPAPGPTPSPAAPVNTPLPQGIGDPPTPPAAYPPARTPGVYAGPPAYRWYGYGAVAPSPKAGATPRGSANWYAQTGATPGAFPVTVAGDGRAVAVEEPPSETPGNLAASAGPFFEREPQPKAAVPSTPAAPPAPVVADAPRFAPDPRQPLPVSVTTTAPPAASSAAPAPEAPAAPERTPLPLLGKPHVAPEPTQRPVVVPESTAARAPAPAPAPSGQQPLLTWTNSSGDGPVAFTAARTAPAPAPSPAPPRAADATPQPLATFTVNAASPRATASVTPASLVAPSPAPAAASVGWAAPASAAAPAPLGRGQRPDAGAPTLEQSVRNAAYGLAAVTEFKVTGPSKVRVGLRAGSAVDAQAAADAVSKLPALRAFAVEFAATIAE